MRRGTFRVKKGQSEENKENLPEIVIGKDGEYSLLSVDLTTLFLSIVL